MRDPRKQAERLIATRLRYTINTHLEDQGITAPSDIARAVGLPAAQAVRLLQRWQWREGDVAALREVADRLGLKVDLEGLGGSAPNTLKNRLLRYYSSGTRTLTDCRAPLNQVFLIATTAVTELSSVAFLVILCRSNRKSLPMSDEQFGWLVTHLDSICEFSLLLLPFTMILLTWVADKLKPPHADDW